MTNLASELIPKMEEIDQIKLENRGYSVSVTGLKPGEYTHEKDQIIIGSHGSDLYARIDAHSVELEHPMHKKDPAQTYGAAVILSHLPEAMKSFSDWGAEAEYGVIPNDAHTVMEKVTRGPIYALLEKAREFIPPEILDIFYEYKHHKDSIEENKHSNSLSNLLRVVSYERLSIFHDALSEFKDKESELDAEKKKMIAAHVLFAEMGAYKHFVSFMDEDYTRETRTPGFEMDWTAPQLMRGILPPDKLNVSKEVERQIGEMYEHYQVWSAKKLPEDVDRNNDLTDFMNKSFGSLAQTEVESISKFIFNYLLQRYGQDVKINYGNGHLDDMTATIGSDRMGQLRRLSKIYDEAVRVGDTASEYAKAKQTKQAITILKSGTFGISENMNGNYRLINEFSNPIENYMLIAPTSLRLDKLAKIANMGDDARKMVLDKGNQSGVKFNEKEYVQWITSEIGLSEEQAKKMYAGHTVEKDTIIALNGFRKGKRTFGGTYTFDDEKTLLAELKQDMNTDDLVLVKITNNNSEKLVELEKLLDDVYNDDREIDETEAGFLREFIVQGDNPIHQMPSPLTVMKMYLDTIVNNEENNSLAMSIARQFKAYAADGVFSAYEQADLKTLVEKVRDSDELFPRDYIEYLSRMLNETTTIIRTNESSEGKTPNQRDESWMANRCIDIVNGMHLGYPVTAEEKMLWTDAHMAAQGKNKGNILKDTMDEIVQVEEQKLDEVMVMRKKVVEALSKDDNEYATAKLLARIDPLTKLMYGEHLEDAEKYRGLFDELHALTHLGDTLHEIMGKRVMFRQPMDLPEFIKFNTARLGLKTHDAITGGDTLMDKYVLMPAIEECTNVVADKTSEKFAKQLGLMRAVMQSNDDRFLEIDYKGLCMDLPPIQVEDGTFFNSLLPGFIAAMQIADQVLPKEIILDRMAAARYSGIIYEEFCSRVANAGLTIEQEDEGEIDFEDGDVF